MSVSGATRSLNLSPLSPLLTVTLTCCASLGALFLSEDSFAKKKSEGVHSVRYSYERLSKMTAEGPQKRYVLMPQPLRVPLESFKSAKDKYRAHFDALKSNKTSNYGKTGFNTSKEDEHVVQIFLDKDKKANHPFIMAEVIYTMIDAGAKHVEFPRSSFSGRPYTKADVSYSAYQLTLPYWEGLPPQTVTGGLLSFPDGTLVTAQALGELLQAKDSKLLNQMVTSLKSGELEPVSAIIKACEALRTNGVTLDALAPGLTPLLGAASKPIRLLALRGLVGIDTQEVNQKLRAVMDEDPEADVQAQASAQLSQSKDPNFSESAQFFALRSSSQEAIIAAARGLATAKNREATARLLLALTHDSKEVRVELIQALIKRKAHNELVKALSGELALDAKIDVSSALILEKDLKVKQQAYEFLARQPNGPAAAQAASTLAQEKKFKPTLSLLAELCAHPEPVARSAALDALRERGGEDALKAASKADIADPKTGALAHSTLRAIYGSLKATIALKAATSPSGDQALRSAAVGALGRLYQTNKKLRKTIFNTLKDLVKSSDAVIRAEVARSLGDVQSDEAKAELVTLSAEDAIEVKRLVAFAWRNYDEESAREVLASNLDADDITLLVNSLDSLGLLGSVKTLSKIRTEAFLKHQDVHIRRAAVGALASLAPKLEGKERAGVVSFTSPMIKDADQEVQLRVVKTLGASPNSESEFALAANFESGSAELTVAIVNALIQHQTVSAVESLNAVIEISNTEARRVMYSARSNLKSDELKATLKKVLLTAQKREQDPALKSLIESELKSL